MVDPVVQMLLMSVAGVFFGVIFPHWIMKKIEKSEWESLRGLQEQMKDR